MKPWIYKHWAALAGLGTAIAIFLAIVCLGGLGACNSLKRSLIVAGAAGAGAVPGLVTGNPVLAAGGAAVAGGAANATVERDAAQDSVERLEDKLVSASTGKPPQPEPWLVERVPWWGWLVALWIWLRRAHLLDTLTGKEPRMDAILRALGLRTHRTPIPRKGGGST